MQCEGGSTMFDIDYFGKKLHLAQTWQLHAEPGIFALEKIFTIQPSFRAEKSKTSRHLTEYWHAEMEVAWEGFDYLQEDAEQAIKHVVSSVLKKNKEELKILNRDTKKLSPILKKKFPRITYDQALKLLKQKKKMNVSWGKDLRTIEEDKLSELFDVPVIVTHYPKQVKAFYMKEADAVQSGVGEPSQFSNQKAKQELSRGAGRRGDSSTNSTTSAKGKVVLGFDMIAPEGYGELIGASQREESIEKLKANLKAQGENPEEYEFYFDTRRYGSVPHGGYGLGIERVIAWICALDSIKDTMPFPRTMTRYYP